MSRRNNKGLLPTRPQNGRIIAGVCCGVGDRLMLDVTLIRLAFLMLALAWGIGVLVYGLLWFLMPPSENTTDTKSGGAFQRTARGIRADLGQSADNFSKGWHRVGRDPWPRPIGRRWMAIGLIVGGVLIFLASIGAFDWLTGTRAFGLAVMAIGAALLVTIKGRG